MSIFSKLFRLFVTVVLMPLIPMALLLGYYQHRQKNTILENHYNLAEIISSDLNQYADVLPWRLSFAPQLAAALQQKESVQPVLQQALQADPELLFLAVLNPDGAEVARAAQAENDPVDLSQSRLWGSPVQTPALRASIIGTNGTEPALEFMYPLDGGYTLYGKQILTGLLERLEQMRIGRTGQVYLASADGTVYTSPYQWAPGIAPRALRQALTGKSRLIKGLPGAAGTLVGAVSSAPRLGVYVVALQPKEEALRSVYLSNVVLVLFVLAIGMLAYFGALVFSRSLGEPIAQLIHGAQEVSRGHLDHRVNEEAGWGELEQLIQSFNEMTADLQDYQALQLKSQVSEMKEQVFRSVAHDLRAPLLGLQGYIYLLAEDTLPPAQQKEYMARMADAVQNLSGLLEDVLAVSRVETGVELPHRQKLLLKPLLTRLVQAQEPLAKKKGLALSVEVSEQAAAWADPKLLQRIVTNLLSNALKFTERGFVKVAAQETDTDTWITVQDSGIGLTEAQCRDIFEKYRQVNEQAEGYGLGLFISRQLARAHGGELSAASVPGQGSTFTLRLPKEEA